MRMQALCPLLSAIALLCACAPEESAVNRVSGDTFFSIPIEGHSLKLQLALTDSERSRGLMHRSHLPENHGMLFLFETPEKQSFWMRNTRIPLDLAYFDARGRLLEIHSLYPYDENSVYSYSGKVLIAVEMNQGWFSRRNIRPGAQLDLNALMQAVVSRGYPFSRYPLEMKQ